MANVCASFLHDGEEAMASDDDRPTLILLHALGGSARSWDAVAAALGPDYRCVALDLPGFGDRAGDARVTVAEMVDWLAGEVRRLDPAAYLLVGHSMGGKLATLAAARAMAGEPGLSALAGVVLLAASPPAPEPMDEGRRREMLGWFADGPIGADDARTFVEDNVAAPLPLGAALLAEEDVRRSGRHAWLAWLERGSREDWSAAAGRIDMPALIVAGADDGDLGEAAQRRLSLPHYPHATVEVVDGAAHLLPAERPEAVAALIAGHWTRVRDRALPPAHARLLASPRVARRTRAALVRRMHPAPAEGCLGPERRALLAALLARLLPHGDPAIDLAATLDADLAAGTGDGWRFAALPPDAAAWAAGLDTIGDLAPGFVGLPAAGQDAWLARLIAGEAGIEASGRLAPAQMRAWAEDVRASAVRAWLAHPRAMARIGYDGFANGGDGPRPQGYQRLAADDLDPWQPAPARTAA